MKGLRKSDRSSNGFTGFLALVLLLVLLWEATALAESYVIRMEEIVKTDEADGVVFATLTASLPQVDGLADTAAMNAVNQTILDFLDMEGFETTCEYAREDYAYRPELFKENVYGLTTTAYIAFSGKYLLSVCYISTFETGGPHPWTEQATLLIDLQTGQPVTIESLFIDPGITQYDIAEIVTGMICAMTDEESGFVNPFQGDAVDFFEDAYDTVMDTPLDHVLIAQEGMEIYYNPEEIATQSSGVVRFLIEYENLYDQENWGKKYGSPTNW